MLCCCQQEAEKLQNHTITMKSEWQKAVGSFNYSVQIFRKLIDKTITYKPLVDAVYIGFDMNVSNEIFSGAFYDNLDVTTLVAKQKLALQFIRESSKDFKSVSNRFRARVVFYTSVNIDYDKKKSVADMLEIATRALVTGHQAPEVRHTCRRREEVVNTYSCRERGTEHL